MNQIVSAVYYSRFGYRLRYWRNKFISAFGFCPKCGHRLNYTSKGRPVCTSC